LGFAPSTSSPAFLLSTSSVEPFLRLALLAEDTPPFGDQDSRCFLDTEDEDALIDGDQPFRDDGNDGGGGGGGGGGGAAGLIRWVKFGAGGGDENFGLLEGPKVVTFSICSYSVEAGGASAGGGECFAGGTTMFLISGEGAENRDFGEVLFE